MTENRSCDGAFGRRELLAGAAALAMTGTAARRARAAKDSAAKYRVGVIGHTGRGNYGHGLDRVWLDLPNTQIVAVADADERGLAQAVKRTKAPKGYRDYRKMLDEAKCDLVSVCPRWPDQHRDMVVAAAERGVKGIYIEKPLARTLAEADEMIAACEKNKVAAAVAHQTRYSPKLAVIRKLIEDGRIGRVIEFRARGKEDRRGGGEDLWVLGTHVLNMMNVLGGRPVWCFATVRQDGRAIAKKDVRPGNEGIGPLAGDEVHAMYGLEGGAPGHFDSVRGAGGRPSRFGLVIYGSKGIIDLYDTGYLPTVHLLEDSSWTPGRTGRRWTPVSSAGPGKPEPLKNGGLHAGNVLAARDLIAAVEAGRKCVSSIHEARTAMEMIVGVFESHRIGGPVALPVKNRKNPLTMLK